MAQMGGIMAQMGGIMAQMEGIVTIVQEARFQLWDDHGVSHLFILSHGASAEPDQLEVLQKRQARVRVKYQRAANLIGLIARSVDVIPDSRQSQRG
jgi:hypothetical protein